MDVQTFCAQVLKVTEPEALRQCIGAIRVLNLHKGQVLLACGEPVMDVYFVKQGVLRGYYFDENGREITECISGTPGMSFMPGFDWHEPARINIGAAAAGTQVFAISVALADAMMANRPEIRQALETGSGEIVRNSDTLNMKNFYYALLLEDGSVLRVATQVRSIVGDRKSVV